MLCHSWCSVWFCIHCKYCTAPSPTPPTIQPHQYSQFTNWLLLTQSGSNWHKCQLKNIYMQKFVSAVFDTMAGVAKMQITDHCRLPHCRRCTSLRNMVTVIHLFSPTSVQGCFIRNMVGAELNLSKSKLIFCKNRLSIAISTWMGVDWQGGLHCTLHCIWNMKQPMSMILSLCWIPINFLVCK